MNPFHEGISLVPLFILYLAEGASNLLECAVYGRCDGEDEPHEGLAFFFMGEKNNNK